MGKKKPPEPKNDFAGEEDLDGATCCYLKRIA